ncbi:MAG: hypothetical protein PsegKO_31130 [Pseudohongiellaceae bacterium]
MSARVWLGKNASKQRGIAMLILFIMLFMVGSSVFLTVLNNNVARLQADGSVQDSLRSAREALIAFAVLHGDYYGAAGAGPGHLPCPDSNGNGAENIPCNSATLGRLPESITVPGGNIHPLNDDLVGIDQQLWYAVSPAFRRSTPGVVNTASVGGLRLDGRTGLAAVLIAPGEALASQSRPSNNDANYLEAGNAGGPNFVSNNPADPDNFNDRLIAIHASDILSPVSARVAETIKQQLDAYHSSNGQYPPDSIEYSAAVSSAPAWFASNQWETNSTYTFLTTDTASISFTGCAIVYTLDQTTPTISRTGYQC